MSTKVLKYISVCVLVLAFAVFGTGVAKATVTVDATSVTSSAALTLTGAADSTWSLSTGALTINSAVTSALTLDSGTTGAVNLGTGAAAKTITIGNAASTLLDLDAISIDIDGAGTGVTIDALDAGSINLGTSAVAASDTSAINIGTSATARTITVGNAASTILDLNAISVDIDGAATGVTIDALDAGSINLGTSADAASDTSAINIGTSATARTITLGGGELSNLVINGRVATEAASGTEIGLDASYTYGEGVEMRYGVDSWTGIGNSFKGYYVRSSANVGSATGGLRGMEVYGVSNVTTGTTGLSNLQSLYAEMLVKASATSKTITDANSVEANVSIENQTGTLTFTNNVYALKAKVQTGTGLADYTKMGGIAVQGRDDGTARVFGNAISIEDPEATVATWTKGLSISAGTTTAISLTGAATTGINIANTATTGINFAGGAANQAIKVGALSSTVPGSGAVISDTNNRAMDINVDDNNVASADTAKLLSVARFRLMRYADSVAEDYAVHGLVKYSGLTKSRWGAGVMGAAETTGAVTLSNLTTGVLGRFGTAATLTLTGAGDRIAAVTAFNNNTVALAGSGKSAGLLVMETDVGTPIDLDYGLEIRPNVATTGISIGTTTTDISLQNGETIDNAVNNQFLFSAPGGANTVTITAADSDANAALTVSSGGTGLATFTGGTTGAVAIGTNGSTTAITLATDGTGDAEVVLPLLSVSGAEMVSDTVTETQLAAILTFANADLVSFASVSVTDATEGLILPQHATTCAAATAEGQVCWDVDSNVLYVGDSAAAVAVAGSTGAANTWTDNQIYTLEGDEDIAITHDAGAANILSITVTPNAVDNAVQAIKIDQAASGNANGLDAAIEVDNSDDTAAITAGLLFTSAGGAITTAVNASATQIGTALKVDANDIVGTTGLINYTNFDVDAAGNITVAAAEGLDTNAAGALEIGFVNATSVVIGSAATTAITLDTDDTGDGTDVVLPNQSIGTAEILNDTITFANISDSSAVDADTTFTAADGITLTLTPTHTAGDTNFLTINADQTDDVNATDDFDVLRLDLTSESGDAGDTFDGIVIIWEEGVANTIMDSALKINNAETTASTMTDAIIVTSSGVDTGITTALNVSDGNIVNAISVGDNIILGGAAVINFTGFDVAATTGATIIAGSAAGTAALTLSLGDLVLADTDTTTITSVNGTTTVVLIDNAGGVQADNTAALLIDAGGNNASGSNMLRLAPTGTPVEGSVGIEFVGSAKVMQAMNIDGDSVNNSVVLLNGGGALADDKAVLEVTADGTMVAGSSLVRIASATAAGGATVYGLEISANANNLEGLWVSAGLSVFAENVTISAGGATITGNSTLAGTFIIGVDDTGYDVQLFGATASAHLLWDESDDDLELNGAAGFTEAAQSLTANSDSGAASSIPAGKRAAVVVGVTAGVNDWIVLPAIASVPIGHTIRIAANASSGFELRTPAASTTTINNINSDGTQEYLVTDTDVVVVTKRTATGWIAVSYTNLGAVRAAVIPD